MGLGVSVCSNLFINHASCIPSLSCLLFIPSLYASINSQDFEFTCTLWNLWAILKASYRSSLWVCGPGSEISTKYITKCSWKLYVWVWWLRLVCTCTMWCQHSCFHWLATTVDPLIHTQVGTEEGVHVVLVDRYPQFRHVVSEVFHC